MSIIISLELSVPNNANIKRNHLIGAIVIPIHSPWKTRGNEIVKKPEDAGPDSLRHLVVENYYAKIVNVVPYLRNVSN